VLAGHSPRPGLLRGRWLALAILCLALLMVNLDNTVLNPAVNARSADRLRRAARPAAS